jgi:hypothetical protein
MFQLGLFTLAAGAVTMLILPGEKAKEGEPAKAGWLSGLKLPFGGSITPPTKPTVGEADILFARLNMLSDELVDDYGDGLANAWKHLTWKKPKPKPEGPTVAAP